MKLIKEYFETLAERIGTNWNRFWYTPSDAYGVSFLRVLTGLMAMYFIASYTADLIRWFGPYGLLSVDTVKLLTGASLAVGADGTIVARESLFYYFDNPAILWVIHALSFLVVLMFTVGLFTRVTSILSFIAILSYIHRAPMLTGQFEPVLTMLILYLCIAPAGVYFSVDRLLRKRKEKASATLHREDESTKYVTATISMRLIQLHVAGFYLMMGITKLAGETWWLGDAVWWLMAHNESRLVDFTFLGRWEAWPVFNLWTHAIVAFELLFGILIWNRLARPLLIGISVIMWTSLALITGLISFCAIMLAANFAFVSSDTLRAVFDSWMKRSEQPVVAKTTTSDVNRSEPVLVA
jgi:hypothetical protein